ncbi:hypothetical protein SAMN04489752_0181 [Brevibacterium siliguriense]|uniref:Uncharacterized protein n=1 Tax=Brevibacterium siliguriense TaxID=1136497 RepID=A0A1H1LPH1_9MICO|nr:hypothetical protein [Brevibacterium siliguriense]SDR76210.1 hypothetical protein SAMN04489752_0181 [Brevibacterium siliguriense]
MTSTDFSFPQPTDDELAAQQPRVPAAPAHPVYATPLSDDLAQAHDTADARTDSAASAKSPTLGKAAVALSIVAMVLSLAASVILGATVGPSEAASGYFFTDTPDWYQTLAIVLVGVQGLCTCLGITGIILGITAAVTGRGRTPGNIAISVAAIAPFVSFGTFIALSFIAA